MRSSRTIEDTRTMLNPGADKVSINSAALVHSYKNGWTMESDSSTCMPVGRSEWKSYVLTEPLLGDPDDLTRNRVFLWKINSARFKVNVQVLGLRENPSPSNWTTDVRKSELGLLLPELNNEEVVWTGYP